MKKGCFFDLEGGIEFDSRNHSQIHGSRENVTLEEYTRGVLFLGAGISQKT